MAQLIAYITFVGIIGLVRMIRHENKGRWRNTDLIRVVDPGRTTRFGRWRMTIDDDLHDRVQVGSLDAPSVLCMNLAD